MTRHLIFIFLFIVSTSAIADANDGEYLGFKLGEKYSAPRGSVGKHHFMGALIYAVDPRKRKQNIGSLSVYVSPKSSITGSIFGAWYFSSKRSGNEFADRYMKNLEKKYGHWKRSGNSLTDGNYQLWVELEERPPIVDYWPSKKKIRVSVALIFAPDSERRKEWMATIHREVRGPKLASGE